MLQLRQDESAPYTKIAILFAVFVIDMLYLLKCNYLKKNFWIILLSYVITFFAFVFEISGLGKVLVFVCFLFRIYVACDACS